MHFLSLSRPWTWAIFDPVADKGVENRTWRPPDHAIGRRIAIQAAQSWDDAAISMFLRLGIDHFPNRRDLYPSGCVVGVATLDRVVTESKSLAATPSQRRWFFEESPDRPRNFGWVLVDRVPLRAPVKCAGRQGLRPLPDDVEAEVLAQLRGAPP